MEYEKIKLSTINLYNQDIDDEKIKHLLYHVYNNIRFSTFPYLTYKCKNSYESLNRYNSGNCIALSYFVKIFLKRNYGVNSHVIIANVPNVYKVNNTPHACHCAIFVPSSPIEFYIIDIAFSFLSGMYCNVKDNKTRQIEFTDIYSYENHKIDYIIEKCNNNVIDEHFHQELLPNSLKVSCNFSHDKTQTWNYYLNEILNPDQAIGSHFLREKHLPFILYSYYDHDDNKVKLMYKLLIDEKGELQLKEYPNGEMIYDGNIASINERQNIDKSILRLMNNHFDDYII
tara:strand:+ start:189 stop:1046 length:858 start_codon:yes stop_codon:yes gene_type:complete